MLIGVIGTIQSGKNELVNYLVDMEDFQPIQLIPSQQHCRENIFNNVQSLLDYVTLNYSKRLVLKEGLIPEVIQQLRKRPFFLLVNVDAPLEIRYNRWCKKYEKELETNSFLEFIKLNDDLLYEAHILKNNSENITMKEIMNVVNVTLENPSEQLSIFHQRIEQVNLLSQNRLRPSWDDYFMLLTELASRRSNCMKRRVGCLIIKDYRVIATGYNGTPRNLTNCNQGGCPRCNQNSSMGENLDLCYCIHAEENALLEAGRERIMNGKSTLYCNTCPCIGCAKKIVQIGIQEVVYAHDYGMDHYTLNLFKSAGVEIRKHKPESILLFDKLN